VLADQPGIQWVIALEHSQSDQREHWLRTLAQWGATDISVIPAMRGVPLYGTDMSHFFSHEVALLRVRNNLRRWPARLTKRLFDLSSAAFLLLVLSPLMLIIALALKLEGGPVLFAHTRVGKNGKAFRCFKFRSMVPNAEDKLQKLLQHNPALKAEWDKEHKLKDDPRISKLGAFLRRNSLDELPQLLNVLKSEMSLVGPRPIVREELQKYGIEKSYYLMVRPGMTGLWQVSGRNDVDYETRVYLDAWYVKNWSLWYDLAILFKTIKVVLWRNGAY
jgi:Undecaprenyl-phosphate galactose phosphotransferase WbaP